MRGIAFTKWRWLFTLIALAILFAAGVLVSLIVGSGQLPVAQLNVNSLLGWRILLYSLLIWVWPFIVKSLLRQRGIKPINALSRWPLAVLIALYEFLIVQNPLAALLNIWSE